MCQNGGYDLTSLVRSISTYRGTSVAGYIKEETSHQTFGITGVMRTTSTKDLEITLGIRPVNM